MSQIMKEKKYISSEADFDAKPAEAKTYKFSFRQYFFRNLLFKMALLLLFIIIMEQSYNRLLNALLLITGTVFGLISCYRFTIAATSTVILEPERANYYYVSRYNEGLADNKRNRLLNIYTYHNHYIEAISSLTIKGNHIFIQGKITNQDTRLGFGMHSTKIGAEKTGTSIKIPRYFQDNAGLAENLKIYITNK